MSSQIVRDQKPVYSEIVHVNTSAKRESTFAQESIEIYENEGEVHDYTDMDFNENEKDAGTDVKEQKDLFDKVTVISSSRSFIKETVKGSASVDKHIFNLTKYQLAIVVLYILLAAIVVISGLAFTTEIALLKKAKAHQESGLNQINENVSVLESQNGLLLEVLGLFTGQTSSNPASSCIVLALFNPSGYYWVRASNGSAVRVYCDMTRSCGGVTGGWTRVAELDMTNSSQQCPSGLRQRTDGDIRTCVRNTDSAGYTSVAYSTSGVSYSRVCGKVIAYQVGTTNAFRDATNDIDSTYVDGISLTHGDPKEHIWTFAAALDEAGTNTDASHYCRCQNILSLNPPSPPSFVGGDYFCDAGNRQNTEGQLLFYATDPLWDGAGCESPSTCCSFNTPPWFYKQLPQPTTDDIEMRVCRNEDATNEDIAIQVAEIYVQ